MRSRSPRLGGGGADVTDAEVAATHSARRAKVQLPSRKMNKRQFWRFAARASNVWSWVNAATCEGEHWPQVSPAFGKRKDRRSCNNRTTCSPGRKSPSLY